MSDTKQVSGKCLCGAIQMQADQASRKIGACHCSTCRTWGGGPLMAVDCGSEVTIQGKEQLGIFDSSDWAERGFCQRCGTHLFYRLKQNNQYIVPAGLLDDTHCVFDHQVFIDEKPDYYSFANQTENMTGAELFAMFGAAED